MGQKLRIKIVSATGFEPGSDDWLTHLKVSVDKLWNDEFWLWLVLTVYDVHLELAVVAFEQVAELDRVLNRFR